MDAPGHIPASAAMARPMSTVGRQRASAAMTMPRRSPTIGISLQCRSTMREGTSSGDVIKPRGGPRPAGGAVWSVICTKLKGNKETRGASRIVPGRGVLRKPGLSAQKEWPAARSESISEAG